MRTGCYAVGRYVNRGPRFFWISRAVACRLLDQQRFAGIFGKAEPD